MPKKKAVRHSDVRSRRRASLALARPSAMRVQDFKPERRLVVLFADNIDPHSRDRTRIRKSMLLLGIKAIESVFNDETARYLSALEESVRRKNPGYPWPRFRNYFFLGVPRGVRKAGLLRRVLALPEVRSAYADSRTKLACTPSTGLCNQSSDHIALAPVGVGLDAARAEPGGKGENQYLADVERGWCVKVAAPGRQFSMVQTHTHLEHLVQPALRVQLVYGVSESGEMKHGTPVLGIACGKDGGSGCRGIAPNISGLALASKMTSNGMMNAYGAVGAGIAYLKQKPPGTGVLLLEIQTGSGFPIETLGLIHGLIKGATEDGIVVVQAAGNEGHNLDQSPQFNATAADSGAILVGACKSSGGPRRPRGDSNFGSRVDCHALGDSIKAPMWNFPTPPGKLDHCGCFGDTSGAAAIIAGVALVLRGIAQARGIALDPPTLRSLLRTHGTPAASGAKIGVMPDLKAILSNFPSS